MLASATCDWVSSNINHATAESIEVPTVLCTQFLILSALAWAEQRPGSQNSVILQDDGLFLLKGFADDVAFLAADDNL